MDTDTFELWDERTGRSIGRWATRAEALAVVRNLLDRGDVLAVAALVLRRSDWSSASDIIAFGSRLVALARESDGEGNREGSPS